MKLTILLAALVVVYLVTAGCGSGETNNASVKSDAADLLKKSAGTDPDLTGPGGAKPAGSGPRPVLAPKGIKR